MYEKNYYRFYWCTPPKYVDAVCFLYDTRLRFLVNGSTDNKGAPKACAMIYRGENFTKFEIVFEKFGAVLNLQKLKEIKKQKEPKEMFLFI